VLLTDSFQQVNEVVVAADVVVNNGALTEVIQAPFYDRADLLAISMVSLVCVHDQHGPGSCQRHTKVIRKNSLVISTKLIDGRDL
jgi:hypothetical protein